MTVKRFGRAAKDTVLPCGCRIAPAGVVTEYCAVGRRLYDRLQEAEERLSWMRLGDPAREQVAWMCTMLRHELQEHLAKRGEMESMFTERELAWLRFYRWMVETGRMTEGSEVYA